MTRNGSSGSPRELTHDETLAWINQQRAWRRARKTAPIWARAAADEEIGKEFQTADRAVEKAHKGAWLCVGIVGEPWFQKPDSLEAKYDRIRSEDKQFAFDDRPRTYHLYKPKQAALNWAAQVQGADITGFCVRPSYDPQVELHSPSGGYVVTSAADPFETTPSDVWLVQKSLFESTYEFVNE